MKQSPLYERRKVTLQTAHTKRDTLCGAFSLSQKVLSIRDLVLRATDYRILQTTETEVRLFAWMRQVRRERLEVTFVQLSAVAEEHNSIKVSQKDSEDVAPIN